MISIRKYLNSPGQPAAAAVSQAAEALFGLSVHVLDSIGRHTLNGSGSEALRAQLAELHAGLRPDYQPEEAVRAGEVVSRILAEYHAGAQQRSMTQALEMQHIFATLNQALIVLAEGRDRSVSRLNQIQESLRRTSMIEDIVALKSSLFETVKYVQKESAFAREAAAEELSRLEAEVSQVRDHMASERTNLEGRPEGIRSVSARLKALPPGQVLYAIAYLCDRLPAVVQRYGPTVADELLFRLIRERIQPVAQGGAAYRWTPSSLVAVFSRPPDLTGLRAEVAGLNRTPVMHRIALGSGTAVLTLAPSHLVIEETSDSAGLLLEQLDEFTGAGVQAAAV
jgi:hypothetical protein